MPLATATPIAQKDPRQGPSRETPHLSYRSEVNSSHRCHCLWRPFAKRTRACSGPRDMVSVAVPDPLLIRRIRFHGQREMEAGGAAHGQLQGRSNARRGE